MKNWKDILSTLCGIIIAVCGAIAGVMQSGLVELPKIVMTICILGVVVAGALLGVFQGKNPNLTAKTPDQITDLNAGK